MPNARPLRWGLGDFLWIYVAGIFAGAVAGSVGFSVSGDTAGHTGALTNALAVSGQYGTWFVGIAYIARAKGRSLRADFGLLLRVRDWWALLVGPVVYGVGIALILPLVHLAGSNQQVVNDLEQATGLKLAVLTVAAVVVAPICEELLFRGLLLRALRRRMSPEQAIIVQALAFALAHPLLSPTLGDLAVVPALYLLGAVSGIVAVRRGNLSASILMHAGFNLVTIVSTIV